MQSPSFWWREGSLAARLLAPLGAIYGAVAAQRMTQPGRTVGIPVICVGNLTIGGAGKTPTAIAVARMLIADGQRPFFLTRGYGGRLAGPVQVDPAHHAAADVGDEPLVLARVAPTIVARDRVAGAAAAREADAEVIVMDDGFQNPSLTKDFSLLVVDGPRGIGNGRVFPAGPLRAPFNSQLARAHALLVIGDEDGSTALTTGKHALGIPVFRGRLEPDLAAVAALAGRKVLAFAGIGHPDKFFATLTGAGISAEVTRGFADHHRYTAKDAEALTTEAERHGIVLVTTEKDLARMSGDTVLTSLTQQARALPVTLDIDEEGRFADLVRSVSTQKR